MDIIKLGKKIKALRDNDGRSQEWVAGQIGTTRQTYAKWETGQTVPDIEMICRIADLFKISLDELVDRHIEKSKKKNVTYADIFRVLFSCNIGIEKLSFCKSNIVILCLYIALRKICDLNEDGMIDKDTYALMLDSVIDKFKNINFVELDNEQTIQIIAPYLYQELLGYEPCSVDLIIKVLTSIDKFKRTYQASVIDYYASSYSEDAQLTVLFEKIEPYIIESRNEFLDRLRLIDSVDLPFNF